MAPETPLIPFEVVLFGFDSHALNSSGAMAADRVAAEAAGLPETRVVVTGHADRSGDSAYKNRLSVRRALAVGEALTARGVERARIETIGRGETEPAVPTADGVAEAANRRAEIFIRYPAAEVPLSSRTPEPAVSVAQARRAADGRRFKTKADWDLHEAWPSRDWALAARPVSSPETRAPGPQSLAWAGR